MSGPYKSRCYTFVAKCEFDIPYSAAADSNYCEWDFNDKYSVCIGYLQFENPRTPPLWDRVSVMFHPSGLQYMSSAIHKVKHFQFGIPKLPIYPTIVPPSVAPAGWDQEKYQKVIVETTARNIQRMIDTRVANSKRRREAQISRRQERKKRKI